MQIETTERGDCIVGVHYECSKDEIEKKRMEVLEQFKRAPVKGFRPGGKVKPDMTAIRLQYSREIEEALKRALAEQAFLDTLFEKEIKPFGTPDFSAANLERDKYSCDFTLKKKPDFELGQYKGLELPKPVSSTSIEAMAQQLLQDLRIRFGDSIQFNENDTVEMTDNATVDYDVFDVLPSGEVKIEALCAKEQLFTVGRSKLDGFDANIIGMKIGDQRTFTIVVPDIGLPSVSGKSLKFVATLLSGSKIKPNPLDDTLAVKTNKKDLQELLGFANELASSKVQEELRKAQITALSAKLVETHEIKVPEWLVLSEAQYLVASAKIDWNTLPKIDQDQYLKMANGTVKISMILDGVRENEPETQLADQEVIEMIRNMVSKMSAEVDKVMSEFNKNGQLVVIAARIRDEYALDFLVKNTKWIE